MPPPYYMGTAYADSAFSQACQDGVDADRVLVYEVPMDAFYRDTWSSIIPVPQNKSVMNAALFLVQRAIDLGFVKVLLEEVRGVPDTSHEEGPVTGFRFWIPLDETSAPEFTGVIQETLHKRIEGRLTSRPPGAKRSRLDSFSETPKVLSEANIKTVQDLAVALRFVYPQLALSGGSGDLQITGVESTSLLTLLSYNGPFIDTLERRKAEGRVCSLQADIAEYYDSTTRRFKFPDEVVCLGRAREFYFQTADDMLDYMHPSVEVPEKLVRAKLEQLDLDRTPKDHVPLSRLLPCSYSEMEGDEDVEYHGQVFNMPLVRMTPIEEAPMMIESHEDRWKQLINPVTFAIREENMNQFRKAALRAKNVSTRIESIKIIASACKTAAAYDRKLNRGVPVEMPRYNLQIAEAESKLERFAQPQNATDRNARNLFYADPLPDYTPLSSQLKQLSEMAQHCSSLLPHQMDAFIITFLLGITVQKDVVGPQPFVLLLGPSECGKSFTLERVVELFSRNMLSEVDDESKKSSTYASSEEDNDMKIILMDEGQSGITRKASNRGDEDAAIKRQKQLSSGVFTRNTVERDPETGKHEVRTHKMMIRNAIFACTNLKIPTHALKTRCLSINVPQPSKDHSGGSATSAAIFNTDGVRSMREPFILAGEATTSLCGVIYALESVGAFKFDTTNAAIIRVLNRYLKQGTETGARVGNYVNAIAESIHVLGLVARWWKRRAGKPFNYAVEHLILFLRMNNVVPVEAYSIASSLVFRSTQVLVEVYTAACALKMLIQTQTEVGAERSTIVFSASGHHMLLKWKMTDLLEKIMPFCPCHGKGVMEAVLDDLMARSADGGVMMLETNGDNPNARSLPVAMVHPSLLFETRARTNAERTILKVLAKILDTKDPERYWPLYNPDQASNVFQEPTAWVFKTSVSDAVLSTPKPVPPPNMFYPTPLRSLGIGEHSAAIAFLDYGNAKEKWTWMTRSAVQIAAFQPTEDAGNSGTYGMNVRGVNKAGNLLVVSADIIDEVRLEDSVIPDQIKCAGLSYGGACATGKLIYDGPTSSPRIVPPLATEAVEIPNPNFIDEGVATLLSTTPSEVSEQSLGELDILAPTMQANEDAEQMLELDLPPQMFPTDKRTVLLEPGYEIEQQRRAFEASNGFTPPVIEAWK